MTSSIRRYEQKLAQGRQHEEAVADLAGHLATDKMLRENYRSDDRVIKRRILNESRAAQKDMYATQQLEAAAASQQREAVLREQDERLAAELARRKTQAVREQKNVQRICEQSEELRELEEKLKAAYMNKERESQIKESASLIAKQAEAEAIMAKDMEADRQRGLQAEAYRDYLRVQDGKSMRKALDAQMEEKEAMKAEAYQAFLKEKDMVDKVVDAILAEDMAEKVARHKKESEIKGYIESFIREQEEYKQKRRLENEAENAEIRAYAEQVMAREQSLRLAREKDQNAKDAILERMTATMAKQQKEKDEMEALRNELVIQETEERILQKEKEKMERAVQQRMDIALANEYQRQLKAIKREEEKAEEELFRTAMLEKVRRAARRHACTARPGWPRHALHRFSPDHCAAYRRASLPLPRRSRAHTHAPSMLTPPVPAPPRLPVRRGRPPGPDERTEAPHEANGAPPRDRAASGGAPRKVRAGARRRAAGAAQRRARRTDPPTDHRGGAQADARGARPEPGPQAPSQGCALH